MSGTDRVSGLELARQFYRACELEFQRAAQAEKTEERGFPFSGDRFDDWAVESRHLPRTARECGDDIERGGVTTARNKLRNRLNTAARAGVGLPRAFSIEANRGRWRVVLTERFLAERPQEIINGIGSRLDHEEREIERTRRMLEEAEHLSDSERLLHLMRLETVELYTFNGAQLYELVVRQAFDPSYKKVNLRRLRKRMTLVMRETSTSKKVKAKGPGRIEVKRKPVRHKTPRAEEG